jgi:hypothetical protein
MGVGRRLVEALEERARSIGQVEMVVSATPSVNTVNFYLGRRFRATASPLPELLALEPDDLHMTQPLDRHSELIPRPALVSLPTRTENSRVDLDQASSRVSSR